MYYIHSNTIFTVFLTSPIFKKAFMKELKANDLPSVRLAFHLFMEERHSKKTWEKYKDRFESHEQFKRGLREFQKAIKDLKI